jgi:flagellar basal body-associated protein FliL
MADADDTKEQEEQEGQEGQEEQEGQEGQEKQKNPEAEKSDKKSLIARFLPWIIMVVVVLICAGAGFSVGRLFAGSGTPEGVKSDSGSVPPGLTEDLKADNDSAENSRKVWYYDLDPVVANLNEPTVTRYVRASLTLEMSADMDAKKGTTFLDEKKPILINWLTVYLSSLGIEDIRGDNNLRSIQSHVRDAFNEKLFPDSKPQIKQVLIKEFPVQ